MNKIFEMLDSIRKKCLSNTKLPLILLMSKPVKTQDQTQEFLDKNKIFYNYQSGFCKHDSTDACLSYITEKIQTGFENGLSMGMIVIRPQKALDTIAHSILLEKMNSLGLSESRVMWFTSYFNK